MTTDCLCQYLPSWSFILQYPCCPAPSVYPLISCTCWLNPVTLPCGTFILQDCTLVYLLSWLHNAHSSILYTWWLCLCLFCTYIHCTSVQSTTGLYTCWLYSHLQFSVPVDCTVIYNTLYLLTVQSSTILCTCWLYIHLQYSLPVDCTVIYCPASPEQRRPSAPSRTHSDGPVSQTLLTSDFKRRELLRAFGTLDDSTPQWRIGKIGVWSL